MTKKMAQKFNDGYSVSPDQLGLPSTQGLPRTLIDSLSQAKNSATQQYNTGSFRARHPGLGVGMDALIGLMTLNPVNAMMFPALGRRKEQRRKAGVNEAYQEYLNNQMTLLGQVKELSTPINDTVLDQSRLDQLNRERTAKGQAAIPDMYQRNIPGMGQDPSTFKQPDVPYLSDAARKSYMGSAFGASDINHMRNLQNNDSSEQYRQPSQVTSSAAGQPGGALIAGAQATQPVQPMADEPMFINDPQTIMQQLTSARNNALTEGQKRYQFDQEAPNRAAQVQKLVSEGKVEEARALLLGAQTQTEKQRPAYIQAQTKFENERSRGGGGGQPNALYLMNPEQRQAYLNDMSGLTSGPLSPAEGEKLWQLETAASEKDWGGKPTKAALNAAAVLKHIKGGSSFGTSSGATAPAPRPTKETVLPSGKKAKI